MIVDAVYEAWRFCDCVGLRELRSSLHMGYRNTLRILERADIYVRRVPYGTRFRYYVLREDARHLALLYGSESARQRRTARSAAKPKGIPLPQRCPLCGKRGRQWRSGLNSKRNREVKCGHCHGHYTVGKRPPLQCTCIHCGATTRQGRQQLTSAGNLTIRCGHCSKHYTVAVNPDSEAPPRAWLAPSVPETVEW